ncbi:MAG: RNA methyltransferase [Deltaproteobacteria bacterium]|nr:RNA methyltransferase [Deltaproteobacteria bacterium]
MRRFKRSRPKSPPPTDAGAGWTYGVRAVTELIDAAPDAIQKLLVTAEVARRVDLKGRTPAIVDRDELTRLLQTDSHQGIAARVRPFKFAAASLLDEIADGVVVVLDHVEDPQNVGAIARSSVVFGARALVIAKDRAAGVTAGTIKASAGAVFRLPVVEVTNIADTARALATRGFAVIGADANGGVSSRDIAWGTKTALILGAERRGLRAIVRDACTAIVRIPQATDRIPLNVSNAAAVLLYEAAAHR